MCIICLAAKAIEERDFCQECVSHVHHHKSSTIGRAKALPIFIFCDTIVIIMAKKNNTKRKLVGLVSEESGVRAYYTKKNTMNTPDKLSLRKYDPVLRKHVLFVETKKNLGRNEVKEKKR